MANGPRAAPRRAAPMRPWVNHQGPRRRPAARPAARPQAAGRRMQPSQSAPPRRITTATRFTQPKPGYVMASMSTLKDDLIPVARTAGTAVPLTGLTRHTVPVLSVAVPHPNDERDQILVISNTGRSGTIMAHISHEKSPSTGNTSDRITMHTIPMLSEKAATGGPTGARAMKAGVSLINTTPSLYRGGLVFVLNTDQRMALPHLPGQLSITHIDEWLATIKAHPDTIAYSAEHFKEAKEFHCGVVDSTTYEAFQPFNGTYTSDEFFSHIISPADGGDSSSFSNQRPMSSIYIVFERSVQVQSYMASARASFYTRWPLDSLGGALASDIPVASAANVDATHKEAKPPKNGARR
jgi:hypothetical protein